MAAFLNEMKTIKLRKTGSLASIRAAGTEVGPPERDNTAAALKRRLSAGGVEPTNKRQRTDDPNTGQSRMFVELATCTFADSILLDTSTMKRRLTTSNASFDFSSIPCNNPQQPTSTQPPKRPFPLTFGSGSTDNTPSLCSDHEPSQENSTEDRLPVTPPHAHRHRSEELHDSPEQPTNETIVIDDSPPALTRFANKRAIERQRSTDVSEMPPPIALSVTTSSPPPVRAPTPNHVFPKRIPSSPMFQLRTPRRPRRPAKSRAVPAEPPRPIDHFSDNELEYLSENDTFTLSVLNEKSFAGVTPYPKSVATGALPAGHARRRTLDEEIQTAENEGLFDGDVLVGIGTRSKNRGFLKGGGAAGTPVHMGVGYVIGAEESEDDQPSGHRTVVDAGDDPGFAVHGADTTVPVEDDTDDEDERLLEKRPSAIPVREGQIAKRSWLPVATTTSVTTAGLHGRGRGRR